MSYENVKLWFAKNNDQDIITIDEINDENKHNTYSCPVCGSTLKPKATKSKQVTSHFAHVDASKCNSESQIHFWFKHKFLEKGDKFTVAADEVRNYICKDILVEKEYEVGDKVYRPDVTITTECGSTIYFEMAFSNKKKVKDYLDIWLELKNIVVEVDIKQLACIDKIPTFKALFYNEKCFHMKKNDTYYNTIGKYKEEKLKGTVDESLKERIRKLDWFWEDVFRYKKGEVDIEHMSMLIDAIDDETDKEILNAILRKKICTNVFNEHLEYKLNKFYSIVISNIKEKDFDEHLDCIRGYIGIDYFHKSLNGYIDIFNKMENCWYKYEIDKKTPEQIIELFNETVKQNIYYINMCSKVDEYNSKLELTLENIKNSKIYKNLLTDRLNYVIKCWANKSNYKSSDIINRNDFKIHFELTYIPSGVTACRFEFNYNPDNGNIDNFLNKVKENAEKYFDKLDILSDDVLLKLKNVVNKLNDKFSNCSVNISGDHFLENIFEIKASLYKDYLISNKGLLKWRTDDIPLISKMDEIEEFLVKDIEVTLLASKSKKCIECNEKFSLELRELQFFIKKGFELPKRCKLCRDKRKLSKQ